MSRKPKNFVSHLIDVMREKGVKRITSKSYGILSEAMTRAKLKVRGTTKSKIYKLKSYLAKDDRFEREKVHGKASNLFGGVFREYDYILKD